MRDARALDRLIVIKQMEGSLPLGCAKSPLSTPVRRALLNCESKEAPDTLGIVLWVWTYFLIAMRLDDSSVSNLRRKRVHVNKIAISHRVMRFIIPAAIPFFQLRSHETRQLKTLLDCGAL